jgi:hypothetical protein
VSRRVVGLIVAAVGAVVVLISAAADLIGISGGGLSGMFGNRQIIGTVGGAAVIAVGLVVAFLPSRSIGWGPNAGSRPTQPVKRRPKR